MSEKLPMQQNPNAIDDNLFIKVADLDLKLRALLKFHEAAINKAVTKKHKNIEKISHSTVLAIHQEIMLGPIKKYLVNIVSTEDEAEQTKH